MSTQLDYEQAIQLVTDDGNEALRVNIVAGGGGGGGATAANQTNGAQKTQVVDGSGNVIGSTANALDVNIKSGVTLEVHLDNANDNVLVYGYDGAVNRAIKTDAAGELQIDVLSSALPSGAATSANQSTEIASLASIDGKVPANLTVSSTRLLVDGSGVTQPVSAASLPLPTGASTAANQTTANASLSSIDGKIVAVNTGAVVVSSSALPTGASTSANQTTGNSSLSSIDGKIVAVNTGAVVVSSSALPTGAATEATLSTLNGKVTAVNTGAVVVASSALPTGASTEATLSTLNGKVPANLTVTSTRLLVDGSGVTQPVSGSVTSTDAGYTASEFVRNDYSGVPVTTAAYVTLVASTAQAYQEFEIFDSSGQTLVIAFGAAASEVNKFLVFPGGNGRVRRNVPSGTRISIKAVSANATVGEIDLNLYG